jgi:hypothetical protein
MWDGVYLLFDGTIAADTFANGRTAIGDAETNHSRWVPSRDLLPVEIFEYKSGDVTKVAVAR